LIEYLLGIEASREERRAALIGYLVALTAVKQHEVILTPYEGGPIIRLSLREVLEPLLFDGYI